MRKKQDSTNPQDQVNIKEENKNIKIFKDKIWKREQVIEVEIAIFFLILFNNIVSSIIYFSLNIAISTSITCSLFHILSLKILMFLFSFLIFT